VRTHRNALRLRGIDDFDDAVARNEPGQIRVRAFTAVSGGTLEAAAEFFRDNQSLYGDPRLHFGEIDADATLACPCTHVSRGSVRRRRQTSLHSRERVMTNWALVSGRRTIVAFQLHHDRGLDPLFSLRPMGAACCSEEHTHSPVQRRGPKAEAPAA
jgi:hypothetical protein